MICSWIDFVRARPPRERKADQASNTLLGYSERWFKERIGAAETDSHGLAMMLIGPFGFRVAVGRKGRRKGW